MRKFALLAAVGAFALSACATDPYTGQQQVSKTAWGAGIGAVAGGAIGALTHTSNGRQAQKNALIGAGIGALAGGGVGLYMDQQQKELAAELRNTGVSVTRQGDNIILNMPGNVTFATDQADIKGNFYPVLNSVAKVLLHYGKTTVDVRGFTDSTGSDEYNLGLSQRRANSVADYLVSQGILAGRLQVTGMGKSNPIASNATPEGRQANRRVEIQIVPFVG
jgi:outer membrane protein OmpA-like peptidoglycan-associated protein